SLKTSIKTITYLSDTGCLEIQGGSLKTKDMSDNHTVCVFLSALADTSSKKAIKKHFKQLLEKLPPLLRQKKRIYMKSHLLTEARTQKLICSLRRKGLDVTAERRESAMNSVMFRILIVSRILSQWKVPHINPRCGIVILTLKNDSGNRE
ncbi:hypothetical protein, partial [Escherichia coli]|uniref:hypothetical protein n=1 Tax=Escherichia coli TaxID=562 RepID=UPI003CF09092